MNNYSKELCHWAFGEKKKNHKYIDRIRDAANKTWRYIYELPKKSQKVAKNFSDSWKDGAETIGRQIKDRVSSQKVENATAKYSSYIYVTPKRKESSLEKAVKFVGDLFKKAYDRSVIVRTVADAVGKVISFIKNLGKKTIRQITKKYPGDPIKTITTQSGETKELYTKEQIEEWDRIKKYQDKEPDFMKDVKNIEPDSNGDLPDRAENLAKVNPDKTKKADASVNCYHCATAYDLRKRGYDVSAKAIESVYSNNDLSEFYDVKVIDPDKKLLDGDSPSAYRYISADKDLSDAQDAIYRYMKNNESSIESRKAIINNMEYAANSNKVLVLDAYKDDHGGTFYFNPTVELSKKSGSKEKYLRDEEFGKMMGGAIKKKLSDMPNDSWGRVSLSWAKGSAHEFVWEKDKNGDLVFLDPQVNMVVDINDYAAAASRGRSIVVTRTDNLNLKPKVKEYIKDNDGSVNEYKPYRF